MGQGTDSCGGWDDEYDVYYEELHSSNPRWTTRDGESIEVSKMTLKHLYGARSVARRAAATANFSCDEDKWDTWVEIFDGEIFRREAVQAQVTSADNTAKLVKKMVVHRVARGAKADMICHCGAEYKAREADLARGWGRSCSKACAATRREFGRPAGKRK